MVGHATRTCPWTASRSAARMASLTRAPWTRSLAPSPTWATPVPPVLGQAEAWNPKQQQVKGRSGRRTRRCVCSGFGSRHLGAESAAVHFSTRHFFVSARGGLRTSWSGFGTLCLSSSDRVTDSAIHGAWAPRAPVRIVPCARSTCMAASYRHIAARMIVYAVAHPMSTNRRGALRKHSANEGLVADVGVAVYIFSRHCGRQA